MAILRFACLALLTGGFLASAAHAQDEARRLDQMLPPASASTKPASAAPASATPASTSPAGTFAAPVNAKPGTYYGDTSGATVAADGDDATDSCDDSTFKKPQVHGTVGVGVFAGKHASGSYRSGAFNVTQRTGDCAHPAGSLSVTVSDTQSRLDYHPRNH